MKKFLFSAALIVAFVTSLEARTWTSADGSKTFEGELRSYDKGSGIARIVFNGRIIPISQDKLSEADREFLASSVSNGPSGKSPSGDIEAQLEQSKVGKQVVGAKLHLVDGKRFKRAEMAKAPEYYILYFSASW